jgi:hypothetical protein
MGIVEELDITGIAAVLLSELKTVEGSQDKELLPKILAELPGCLPEEGEISTQTGEEHKGIKSDSVKSTDENLQSISSNEEDIQIDLDLDDAPGMPFESDFIDLNLNLDYAPLSKNNSDDNNKTSSDLPDLSMFWPGKTAQYWIPSDENQNGKHLCTDLSLALQDNPELTPSDQVALLFYHGSSNLVPSILSFEDPNNPHIRRCTKSVENELYNKNIKDQRLLLVPTLAIPKGKLLILTVPVPNMGVLEGATDICWAMKYISNDNERCVFFEEGNSPNTLRHSQALSEISKGGKLYIVMCAWGLIADGGMATDVNKPRTAARKMFKKQADTLCPNAWRRILKGEKQKGLRILIKDLFNDLDESGIYQIKNTVIPTQSTKKIVPFKTEMAESATAELKNTYLETLPLLKQKLKNKSFDVVIPKNKTISLLTKVIFDYLVSQQNCFPPEETTNKALRCCIAYLAYVSSCKIVSNFSNTIKKIISKIGQLPDYPSGKQYLWTYFPDFNSLCDKELAQMSEKLSKVQNSLWITAANKEQMQ